MFKQAFVFILLFGVLFSHSNAEKSPDAAAEVPLPNCRCVCRTSRLRIMFTSMRCSRQRGLCSLRWCRKKGLRGVRCCIIFKLAKDEDAKESTDASDTQAIPYPALGGSCDGTNVVNNFFSALTLNDATPLTRVKIAFCVASRDIGKRMFDAVVDKINDRFESSIVKTLTDARELIREEAVIADAFALGYYGAPPAILAAPRTDS